MKAVNVATLKNELSRYLGYVRRGEQILVKDRQRPIARIVPLETHESQDEELLALAAAGALKLPDKPYRELDWLDSLLESRIAGRSISRTIRQERDAR